jgi:DNA-binding NarL/FixJ family response regulator
MPVSPKPPEADLLRFISVHRLHIAVADVIRALELTPRQGDVLRLAVDGRNRPAIAKALRVQVDTVQSYAKLVCRKAHVRSLHLLVNDVFRLASGHAYAGTSSPILGPLAKRYAAAGL